MIRFINCVRRRADVSPEAFRRYWGDERFDALIRRVAERTGALRAGKSLTLAVEANVWVREERGGREPYDGTIEYWWENAAELIRVVGTPGTQALFHEMALYQQAFVDFSASTAFFTEG